LDMPVYFFPWWLSLSREYSGKFWNYVTVYYGPMFAWSLSFADRGTFQDVVTN
jgi:hypothetical protein